MKSGPLRNLWLALTSVVLLLIVTSPVTTIWLIKRQADRIVSDSLQGLATSSLATIHVSEGFLDTAIAVTGGKIGVDALIGHLDETSRRVDAEYENLRGTLRTGEEVRAFDHMISCRLTYRQTRKAVIDLLKEGKTAEAKTLFEEQCVGKFQTYATALGDVVEHNAKEAKARGAKIIQLCYVLLGIQLVLLLFFFIYGFFVPLTAVWERLSRRTIDFPG